jgi:uncharacterized protein (DUF58 family)
VQQPYFDAKTLQRVKDLPLVIKTLAQGFLHGIHISQQRGVGIEFSQFRAYEPGDELSKIDWKLFARSDKYFVREAERESDVNVWLVIDCSESMLQKSIQIKDEAKQPIQDVGRWHKLDYARYLAATISYLAQNQGDSVGLLALSGQQPFQIPAYSGSKHWQKILLSLTKINASGSVPETKQVLKYLHSMQENSLIVVISDFHQTHDELLSLTLQLKHSKTDVIAFHLDSDDEINFPYQGMVKFKDLESGQNLTVAAKDVRINYLEKKAQINKQLIAQCVKNNINYFKANIDQPLDESLADFLQVRTRGSRR